MPRFITSAQDTPERNLMRYAARRAHYITHTAQYRTEMQTEPGDLLYGGTLWCDVVAATLGLTLLETPLDWLATAPHALTGRAIQLTTTQEARDSTSHLFYKPLDGKTPLPGLYLGSELPDGPETLLQQGVLEISLEVRAFVLHGEVKTASLYAFHPRPAATPMPPGEDLKQIQELAYAAAEHNTAPATVIDFAHSGVDGSCWNKMPHGVPLCTRATRIVPSR